MKKKTFSMINNIKLQNKLIICFLTLNIMSLGIMGGYIITRTSGFMREQMEQSTFKTALQLKENIKDKLNICIKVSESYYCDSYLQSLLISNYTSDFDMLIACQNYILPVLTRNSNNSDYKRISIYLNDSGFLQDGSSLMDVSDIKCSDFYKETIEAQGSVVWSNVENVGGEKSIYLTRLLNVINKNQPAGILLIEIPYEVLHSLYEKEAEGKYILILNQRGNIVSSTESALVGLNLIQTSYGCLENAEQNKILDTKINGQNVKVIVNSIDFQGCKEKWKIISVIPVEKLLTNVNNVIKISIIFCAATAIITIILIFIFSQGLTKRIRMLSKNIDRVKQQSFDKLINIEGKDEIGILSMQFNKMAEEIDGLINEVYKQQLTKMELMFKQKQAELDAFQSKINPHFLFNTLDSIRMNAIVDEKEKVVVLLAGLSRLLRYSTGKEQDKVTLKSEIANINEYVGIYKIRYGDIISVLINIPGNLQTCIIPKLILQPIVENSFIHGLKNKRGTLKLEITAQSMEDGSILICIEDNGCGIESDRLAVLNKSLMENEESEKKSMGIKNVNDRIKLFFGEQYGIRIESEYDRGTAVYMYIPYIEHGGAFDEDAFTC